MDVPVVVDDELDKHPRARLHAVGVFRSCPPVQPPAADAGLRIHRSKDAQSLGLQVAIVGHVNARKLLKALQILRQQRPVGPQDEFRLGDTLPYRRHQVKHPFRLDERLIVVMPADEALKAKLTIHPCGDVNDSFVIQCVIGIDVCVPLPVKAWASIVEASQIAPGMEFED